MLYIEDILNILGLWLFMWNSNLTRHHIFLFATSGNRISRVPWTILHISRKRCLMVMVISLTFKRTADIYILLNYKKTFSILSLFLCLSVIAVSIILPAPCKLERWIKDRWHRQGKWVWSHSNYLLFFV